MEQVKMPKWLDREYKGATMVIEKINEELGKNPNASLADFAKQLDEAIVEGSYQRNMQYIFSRFER